VTGIPPVWLNGKLVPLGAASLSPLDRGFTLGDGVFETIRAEGTELLWLDDHLSRLRGGADVLGIPLAMPEEAIATGLQTLVREGGFAASALRLTLSRGPSERRGLWPPSLPSAPTLLAMTAPLAPPRPPLRLAIARETRRNEFSPLSRIKSLNYGDNILARREADARGFDDALMLNTGGRIACATVGNLFLRIGGEWRTPPIGEGVLPGLARARLLVQLPAREMAIEETDVSRAEAGLISNSLGVSAIREIEGCSLPEAEIKVDFWEIFAASI